MIRYFSRHAKTVKHFQSFDEDLTIKHIWGNDSPNNLRIVHQIGYWHWKGRNKIIKKTPPKDVGYPELADATHTIKFKDRETTRKALKRIRTKFRYQHEWVNFRKDIIKALYTPVEKLWEDVLDDKVAIWASQKLQHLKQKYGDNCTDNYRVAKVGNSPQERRYRRQYKQGCCGFFDCIEICPKDGQAYRLGFNYGH